MQRKKQPWTLLAFSDAQHDPKADCKMILSVCLCLLPVGSEYKSQAACASADLLCSHCDLIVNVLGFHLYLRTDESMLGLASLSTQTKSIFQTLSVVPINCSPSEVMSGLEVTVPSIHSVSYSHKCATNRSGIKSLFNWHFFLFSCKKTVSMQQAHCEASGWVGIKSLMFSLCFHYGTEYSEPCLCVSLIIKSFSVHKAELCSLICMEPLLWSKRDYS